MIQALGTIIAALVALVGVLLSQIGNRQQALREAELLQKLRDLGLDDSAAYVEQILEARIWTWSTRYQRSMYRFAIIVGIFLALAGGLQIALNVSKQPAELGLVESIAFTGVGIIFSVMSQRLGPWVYVRKRNDRSRYIAPPNANEILNGSRGRKAVKRSSRDSTEDKDTQPSP